MGLPTNRLVIPTSRLRVAAQLFALAVWVALVVYIALFTAPPFVVIVLFSLPVPLFVWLALALRKTIVIEIDATGVRRIRGRRLLTSLPFQEVGSVETRYNPALRASVLRVRNRNGKNRMVFISSPLISEQDIQFLHQAIATRARGLGIPVAPYVELPPELQPPLDTERVAHGMRTRASTRARFALAWLAIIAVPVPVVRVLFPDGGEAAGAVYFFLVFAGMLLVFRSQAGRIGKWAAKMVGLSKNR